MLEAALRLFSEKGFAKTTMQSVADEAGVGIATLFRYFKTKTGVLAALTWKDVNEVFDIGEQIASNPAGSVVDAVTELTLHYVTLLEKPSKNLAFGAPVVLGVKTGTPELDEIIEWADEKTVKQIHKLLSHYRKNNQLSREHSLSDLANIIYSVANNHYITYVSTNDSDYTSLRQNLARRIPVLFKPWLPG